MLNVDKDGNKVTPRNIFLHSETEWWFKCEEKNHEFCMAICNVARGAWCHKCLYKNQTKCVGYLEKISGEKFPTSKPKFLNGLQLDGYNADLKLAIEYNGAQHYEYSPKFFHKGGEHLFTEQQKRDKLKEQLCEANDIFLIVVPYYEKNPEQLIEQEYNRYLEQKNKIKNIKDKKICATNRK